MKNWIFVGVLLAAMLFSCHPRRSNESEAAELAEVDTVPVEIVEEPDTISFSEIILTEDLLFKDYHLDSVYAYKDTTRSIKLDQIKEKLAFVENLEDEIGQWAVVENYRNMNGEAPTVANYVRNEYKRVSDTLGVERYQSAPLYIVNDTTQPVLYARDGWLTHLLDSVGSYYHITPIRNEIGEFFIPKRYVRPLGTGKTFNKVIFVDRGDQNIVTTERVERGKWVIRSTNPATTGRKKPPYAMETPLGIFLLQQKKAKMFYTHDGTSTIAGYAPWASRFTNGAYVHGVPVNSPNGKIIEYSASLGTTPRSHMCVRNASSHAKFVYDWAPTNESLVIVIE
ncbi:MAG: L,D-transpeptidase [Bacteroidales bacterium]|uniref:L,D-transpeptidase n=1 Tax=Porphyromonas sp. TaxID=1924944 RepID=UPI0029759003|nr:L,D-transpeptidase [Porphyromonas sp.]MDD7437755.1 L,D-transpeptidase [Bacteroidales bacterium]MDY3067262.1 L,D-transpeptidase [Porphyromonas sp.]